jgi:hypothetical protein
MPSHCQLRLVMPVSHQIRDVLVGFNTLYGVPSEVLIVHIAKSDDADLVAALNVYHHENCSNNEKISKRLLAEHGITMRCVILARLVSFFINENSCSATTVKRRRKELGLTGSGVTTREMLPQVSEQLVLDKMDKDPAKRHGVRTIRQKIAHEDGVQLTRYDPGKPYSLGADPAAGLESPRSCIFMIETPLISVNRLQKKLCDFPNSH